MTVTSPSKVTRQRDSESDTPEMYLCKYPMDYVTDGGALEDDLDASTCSSITEPDVSASLVNVPPVCYVHAFQDEHHLRPSSDPVGQSATQAGYRAQQARREHIRKERRYIPQRLMEVNLAFLTRAEIKFAYSIWFS